MNLLRKFDIQLKEMNEDGISYDCSMIFNGNFFNLIEHIYFIIGYVYLLR